MSNEEMIAMLTSVAEAVAAGLSAVVESLDQLTLEVQRLRREIHEQRANPGQTWLPMPGGGS